jgi:hypothetical protein
MQMKPRISMIPVGLTLLCLGLFVGSAQAWGPGGHPQVADIAWTRLSPTARTKIKSILFAGDNSIKPDDDSEGEVRNSFRKGANFPDVIKGDHNT